MMTKTVNQIVLMIVNSRQIVLMIANLRQILIKIVLMMIMKKKKIIVIVLIIQPAVIMELKLLNHNPFPNERKMQKRNGHRVNLDHIIGLPLVNQTIRIIISMIVVLKQLEKPRIHRLLRLFPYRMLKNLVRKKMIHKIKYLLFVRMQKEKKQIIVLMMMKMMMMYQIGIQMIQVKMCLNQK